MSAPSPSPVVDLASATPRPPTSSVVNRGLWMAAGVLTLAAVAALIWVARPNAAEREARQWLGEFVVLRQGHGHQRLPATPLSPEGQQVLVNRLVRPEMPLARSWDVFCRKLPREIADRLPRLPLSRDQVIEVGPALIELSHVPGLRQRLLEAALQPKAANRMYAVQFANTWPVPGDLLPLLERLAQDEDPYVRMRVALMLHGIVDWTPPVEQLLARLDSDQVAIVREAARYSFRSDADGNSVPEERSHAANHP